MKVVINKCYGGFDLSEEAMKAYYKLKGKEVFKSGDDLFSSYFDTEIPELYKQYNFTSTVCNPKDKNYKSYNEWYNLHVLSDSLIPRNDPDLVAVVENLGDKASGRFAKLSVVKIPDNVEYSIEEYDGFEHIAEVHRTWN